MEAFNKGVVETMMESGDFVDALTEHLDNIEARKDPRGRIQEDQWLHGYGEYEKRELKTDLPIGIVDDTYSQVLRLHAYMTEALYIVGANGQPDIVEIPIEYVE